MRTVCPNCTEPADVPDAYEGHEIKCKACKTVYLAKPQPVIINPNPAPPHDPPKSPEELMGLPSSQFPRIMGAICIAIAILSFFIGAVAESAEIAIIGFWGNLLTASILYSLGAIIDAINKNTMRKK